MAAIPAAASVGGKADSRGMSSWILDIPLGRFFLDFALLSLLLIVATWLRSRVQLIQKFLIPNNLIAGFLGLMIGMNGLGWIDLTTERLGGYIYHLLALLFIAVGLRAPKQQVGLSSVKFGLIFISVYLVQALIGLSIAFLLIWAFMPELFAGIGLLAPLAFGMNPGIAYTIGQNWELHGFESGAVVGLTFAAIGFLVAYTVGLWLLHRGVRAGKAAYLSKAEQLPEEVRTGLFPSDKKPKGGHLTTSGEAIESLTFHLSLIGLAYLVTWLSLSGIEKVLVLNGAEQEVNTLWSFHFIAAAVVALFIRMVIDKLKLGYLVDDTTMTRSANLFMDFMIVASVAAISWGVVREYLVPLVLISIFVAAATWLLIHRMTRETFREFQLERFIAIFGNLTGTIQSALVLLRVLDSRLKSPVSYNLVYGSGLALLFGFPLLLLINAPVHYFEDVTLGFAYVGVALFGYLLLILGAWHFLSNRNK